MHFAAKAASLLAASLFLTLGFSIGGSAEGGEPTLLFDTLTGEIWDIENVRPAGDSCGSWVSSNAATTITSISVYITPQGAGQIRFFIMDHETHTVLFITDPQPLAADGIGWYESTTFSYDLPAGSYDISAIADVPVDYHHDTFVEMGPIFSSFSANGNFRDFDAPVQYGHAGADCGVRLYTDGKAGPIETNVFTCTFPDDGAPFRGKQRCDLPGTVVGMKQGGTISHHQSECRYYYDEGGPMKRIFRNTMVPDGANVKIVCRNSVAGDVTIDLDPGII